MIATWVKRLLNPLLVVVLVGLVCGCSTPEVPESTSTLPRPNTDAPADTEIAAAVKQLYPNSDFVLPSELKDGVMSGTLVIGTVEQRADGRWLVTVCLEPPMFASSCPLVVVMARDAGCWQVLSEKQGLLDDTTPSSAMVDK